MLFRSGEDAFGGCSSLQSITIPSSVESIGRRAFNGCSNLVKIELPFIGMGNGNDEFTDFFGYIFEQGLIYLIKTMCLHR